MSLIPMPQVPDSASSGTVVRWLKGVGDAVRKGDLLVWIETESAWVELESAVEGRVVEILVPEGHSAAIGAGLCRIEKLGDKSVEARTDMNASEKQPTAKSSPSKTETEQTVLSTPSTSSTPSTPRGETQGVPAVTPILMPQAGQSMEEGTLVEWRVQEGDRIEKGQVIFEVETDKATVEVEADHGGRVARIVTPVGETVAVKVPVAYLAESDSDVDAYLATQTGTDAARASTDGTRTERAESRSDASTYLGAREPAAFPPSIRSISSSPSTVSTSPQEPGGPMSVGDRPKVSPAARRAAAERGLDVAALDAGSGPGGRILSGDVAGVSAVVVAAGAGGAEAPTRKRMSPMRRAIARNVTASKQTIPHFYMRLTIDAAPLMRAYESRRGTLKCSLNDFIVTACAKAIHEFPAFRSRLEGEEIVEFPSANIGIAVGLEDGLVVPVVVGADRMPFERLAVETRRVIDAARSGRVEGVGQGVFSITNLGMFEVEAFSAIINPPEVAILAVGAVREEPVVRDGAIRPGRVMTMTLSCDHRLIDGLSAAKFCARLKELLESPETL